MNDDLEVLRYPVGRFDPAVPVDISERTPAIDALAALPARIRAATEGLSEEHLDLQYRPGGWTVRQLVHHVGDSHTNGYIRLKLALTENTPTIKPYDQDEWVKLPDSRLPLDVTLGILDGIHTRWAVLWRSLSSAQFARTFHHPEIGTVSLDTHLQLYAWHSRHHVAQIVALRNREGLG